MTTQERIERGDDLYTLMTHVPGENFGARPRCADPDVDPDLHFPVSEDMSRPAIRRQIEQAKVICRECPLIAECLANALHRGNHGIWGGTTETERAQIRIANGLTGPRTTVTPLSVDEIADGAGRVLADLERVAGKKLPLLRGRVRDALYRSRQRGDSPERQVDVVMALVRPEIELLTELQDGGIEEVAA
ncbi:WhiB family transcriptional regulator [Saccharopolyspora shandongensis]|uniref:WhiB family transcriptional regulator n=1 Tax=Saccharopolyspora shandongensis TaxID=418495 RepID=UPI00340C0BE2